MKDLYKNPVLYYILVPVLAALWPLLVWAVYLPNAEDSWQSDKVQYEKAQKIMKEILTLDPDRLKLSGSETTAVEFDYATAIDEIARSCLIASANYTVSSKPARIKNKQKSQSAMVILNDVDITKFAKFLSAIQLRWANLQCERLKLTRNQGLPDAWKADLDFKYYY